MKISQEIKELACEGLLHFHPKKTLARDLRISAGSVRDWAIFLRHNDFEWIYSQKKRRPDVLKLAIDYWFDQYPIGYSDVAYKFGLRPANFYTSLLRRIAKLPEISRPPRIRFWDTKPSPSLGACRMAINKLSDIPANRPLTLQERKALLREVQEAKDRLICSEALLEVAVESCKDELKKKELQRQLGQTRKVLASFESAGPLA